MSHYYDSYEFKIDVYATAKRLFSPARKIVTVYNVVRNCPRKITALPLERELTRIFEQVGNGACRSACRIIFLITNCGRYKRETWSFSITSDTWLEIVG